MPRRGRFKIELVLAWLLVCGQTAGLLGLPALSSPRLSKHGTAAYPCQNRPCGCLTYDACWKGDCCCFTLNQKLDWAKEHNIEPPEYARQAISKIKNKLPQPTKKKSCCNNASESEIQLSVTWVTTIFAKKCHGENLHPASPTGEVQTIELLHVSLPSFSVEPKRKPAADCLLPSLSFAPPTPPPKACL